MIKFLERAIYPLRVMNLLMILGEGWKNLKINALFIVVDTLTSYNAILGQNTLNPNKIIAFTMYKYMKLPITHGIREVFVTYPL